MKALRVILVRPQNAGNVGSVARAMRNMGTSDLVLVDPQASPRDELAVAMATRHASDILESARIVATLDEALADCVVTAGTSARVGGLYRRQTVLELPDAAGKLAEALATGTVGLVFGPERTGLENDEITRLHWQVTVPADDEYPVMNLAQAATVCLWEVRRAWLLGERRGVSPPSDAVACVEDQERMFGRLRAALARVRFLRGGRANALFHAVRHLISRARPTDMEVKVLLGLAQQLDYVADRATLDEPSREGEVPAEPTTLGSVQKGFDRTGSSIVGSAGASPSHKILDRTGSSIVGSAGASPSREPLSPSPEPPPAAGESDIPPPRAGR